MFSSKKLRAASPILVSLGVVVALLLIVTSIRAQVAGATLSGTVTDASGAVVTQAQISIKNSATGIITVVPTNSAGFYVAPNLLPGSYEVVATASGFATAVRKGLTLTVGAAAVLNLTLTVGQVSQTVEVSADAVSVDLGSATIGNVVNSTTVVDMPLNGRSWTDLATLQPGVSGVETQFALTSGADRGMRGFGAQISISGARPHQNNYRLDGISLNDYANAGPGSVLGGNLGVDAIQEFSVLTSNYSAEYGKTSGGVVNAITRSGTNQFHGSVYEFVRNSALDARNFFDTTLPPFRRNQFGGGAGGPIRKDRTFIFGDFEAVRQSKGITQVSTVPSPNARNGILAGGAPLTGPCPFPNSTKLAPGAATVCVDNAIQKFLGLFPLPNGALLSPDKGRFTFAGAQIINENYFTSRVDHRFSEKDSLFGTYMYDHSEFSQPDNFDAVLLGHRVNRHFVAVEETHMFSPTVVNSARLGYNRASADIDQGIKAINPLGADTSLGAAPGLNAPQVSIGGLSPGFNGGLNTPTSAHYHWNSFQGYDDASLTRGAHSMKFGGGVERIDWNHLSSNVTGGQYNFASLSDFLNNIPSRLKLLIPGLLSPRDIRQTIFGLYVQDDWRVRPNLTLNMGLRYEISSVPIEVQGKLPVLYNPSDPEPHCGKLYSGCLAVGPYFQNPTLRNFEPRVGFAWDPFRTGKTSVRGGFGIFDVLPLPVEFTQAQDTSSPFTVQETVTKQQGLPQGAFPGGALPYLKPSALTNVYIDRRPARNYAMQWNLIVQRELTPTLAATVGYVGSHGVHQPVKPEDMNITLPFALTPVGYVWPAPQASGSLINSNFGDVRGVFYNGSSSYNALQFGVQKRMSYGIQFQTSYTWGRSIDTGSASGTGDTFANAIASPPWFDLRLSRGLSDFNVSQILVINVTWQVPEIKSLSGPAAWLANGWELSSIYKANTGVPFSATWGTDGDPLGLNSTDPWDVPNRLGGPGCESLINPGNPNNYIKTQCFAVPTAPSMAYWSKYCDTTKIGIYGPSPSTPEPFPLCFNLRGNAGRNILIGPGLSNLDFSILKNNRVRRISESFNVQFRAEFFNILNHPNFAVPVTPNNTDIFDSTGVPTGVAGLLTSTTTDSREIQFALKVIW